MDKRKALEQVRAAIAAERQKRLSAIAQGGTSKVPAEQGKTPVAAVKALSKLGCKSFEQAIKINTADKKFSYAGRELLDRVKALKEAADVAVLTANWINMKEKRAERGLPLMKVEETGRAFDELQQCVKAFGIDSGDEGFEWIPTMVSDNYIDEYDLERKVSSLFMEVKMPSDPYKWPVLTNGAVARMVGEVTALSTPQVFKTDKTITFDSVKLTSQYALPEELNEDSAVDQVKVIRQEVIEGQEKALEIAILEGDTAGTMHYTSQLPDVAGGTLISALSDTPEKSFDGIRVRLLAASATADAGGNAVTEAELSSARGKMGKFGVNPAELVYIAGSKTYNQMLQLDDVRTIEQYGQQATVLQGELAKYEGAPVIVSEWLREDTSSGGKNTNGGSNDRGTIMLVNRKRWFVGTRRAIQVLVEKNRTQYDVLDLVSFARKAFQAVLKKDGSNYATESSGAMVINIGL